MICVSIGRGRHKMMMAEHKHLAENGAELVELRLDYIRRAVQVKRLLEDRKCPAIMTVRRPKDGGKWRHSEQDRIVLLRSAVVAGVEYVDIEEDIAPQIPRFGKTKRIISYHNFHETPDDIEEIFERMHGHDPDIIKIATTANHPSDNTRVLRLSKQSDVPVISFCMGDIGMPSRILCMKMGSPFTYASFHNERKLAPGQMSAKEMVDKYHVNEVNPETQILGVIADPIGHSLSPVVHNANIRKLGLNMLYLPFRVPRDDLDQFIEDTQEVGITGLSVTIPHKENVLRSINALDEDVAGIRACNTLIFKGTETFGYNTDCRAAMRSLAHMDQRSNEDKPFEGRKALILGYGGVAKALAFGILKGGGQVVLTGRNIKNAEILASHFGCQSIDWMARHSAEFDYLINCTPCGMFPNMDESPFEGDSITKDHIVFDTIYNPEQTLLVKEAREANARVITGVDMFVHQAAMQFKLFTGQEADVRLMRYEVKRALSAAKY